MADTDYIYDVEPGQFDRNVLEESARRPVVVDFWAEWCAPCRALGPVLERVVRSHDGRVALARVDIEREREAAARYGVQSIPMVIIFANGRVAAQFVGAQPESEVARIIAAVAPSVADQLVSEGDQLAADGRMADAVAKYREALDGRADHAGALLRLGGHRLADGDAEGARELLSRVQESDAEYGEARGLLGRIEFAEVCRAGGGRAACQERAAGAAEDDLDALYSLACCLAADSDYEDALGLFLRIVGTDRTFRDDAAREAMLRIFTLIGPDSDVTKAYRRKLAAALY